MQVVNVSGMKYLDNVDSNATTNTASTLSTLGFTIVRGAGAAGRIKHVDMVLIYVETAAIRLGKGTPTQAGLGLPIQPGQFVLLETRKEVEQTEFISAAAGVHATLQAQLGYKR